MADWLFYFRNCVVLSQLLVFFQYRAEVIRAEHGEVPKLAEGTPLERVQVVNSGAGVQIPPSPFVIS